MDRETIAFLIIACMALAIYLLLNSLIHMDNQRLADEFIRKEQTNGQTIQQ